MQSLFNLLRDREQRLLSGWSLVFAWLARVNPLDEEDACPEQRQRLTCLGWRNAGRSPGFCVYLGHGDSWSISMNAHSFFNAQVWDLRSQNLSIKDIAGEANLDPRVVLQRLSFDGFNQYTVTESELEEAGLEWWDAQEFGIEVVSGTDA